MFSGTFSRHEIVRRIDQRDVSEGLRKISELASKNRIVFLGQQANVVAQIQQTLEEIARLLRAAGHRIVIGEPKRARQERAFARRKSIDAGLGRVSQHQAFVNQFALDCVYS